VRAAIALKAFAQAVLRPGERWLQAFEDDRFRFDKYQNQTPEALALLAFGEIERDNRLQRPRPSTLEDESGAR
jgi:hypothetical protein